MNQNHLNQIGFFQFDNLIKNRVPFCLVNFSETTTQFYTSLAKNHLEGVEMLCNLSDYKQKIAEKKLSKDFAIVLLCKNGDLTRKLVTEFIDQGFGNAYYVEGGMAEILELKGKHS